MGFRLAFERDAVRLYAMTVAEEPELARPLRLSLRILDLLRERKGKVPQGDIVEATGASDEGVRKALRTLEGQKKVIKFADEHTGRNHPVSWGLTSDQPESSP